jgi:hypothetical protein
MGKQIAVHEVTRLKWILDMLATEWNNIDIKFHCSC